jgi:hypothetical protein
MCDCEPNQFERVEYRKARKVHKCYECRRSIQIGDRYECWTGMFDGRIDRYKTCDDCAKLRDWLNKRTDCCIAFGELTTELLEADIISHVDRHGNGRGYILDPDETELELIGDRVRLKQVEK